MIRSKRIPIVAVVLFLMASTLASTSAAFAGTPTTEIFQVGEFDNSWDEFDTDGWTGVPSASPGNFNAANYPAGIIDQSAVAPGGIHDERGVPELNINFTLDHDYIDMTLTLAKFGVESDTVVVVGGSTYTVPGAGEGVLSTTAIDIGGLAAGPNTITVTFAPLPEPQGNGAHPWDALKLEGDQVPTGEITSPSEGDILLVGETLVLGAVYDDDDPSGVQWAVRLGTCAAGVGTVAGNVDGYSDGFSWDGAIFGASFDTTGWSVGDYCFVWNPVETNNEPNMRLTQEFRIADGHINGGGQIIEAIGPKEKDAFKVSFGGELWQFGSTVECEWTVQFHNVSLDDLDTATFHGSTCTVPGTFNPGAADGVTNFAVYGTLDGESGYTVVIRMEDYTEPGRDDTIRFELFDDPGMTVTAGNSLGIAALYDTSDKAPGNHPGQDFVSGSDNNGSARTVLDRGNLQIDLR